MNSIAKQNLNRLINHNVLLCTMVIISCLQIYNYIRLNKVSCIFIFLVTFILSFQAVSKNITISLFLAIFVANFLLGCASFMEGHTVMVHTPFPHDHKDPIDTKMMPGFDGGVAPGTDTLDPVYGAPGAVVGAVVPGAGATGAVGGVAPGATGAVVPGAGVPGATGTGAVGPGVPGVDGSPGVVVGGDNFTNMGGKLPAAADWPTMATSWSKY